MPDPAGTILEYQLDLALWSLLVPIAALALLIPVAVCWYRNKPAFPIAVFAVSTIIGLVVWPVLAIVSVILLAAVILTATLRPQPAVSESASNDYASPAGVSATDR